MKTLFTAAAVSLTLLGAPLTSHASLLSTVTAIPDFAALAKSQSLAVVNIKTSEGATHFNSDVDEVPGLELLRQFGVDVHVEAFHQGDEANTTGFFIDREGLILTSARALGSARTVSVTLTDGRNVKGEVLGVDLPSDVALIRVEGKAWPALKLGNSDAVASGDWVATLGNLTGPSTTIMRGLIAGVTPADASPRHTPHFEIDAPARSLMAGAPLFNASGDVIGMQSYRVTAGLNLPVATPINVIQKVKAALLAHGKVEAGVLGVGTQNVDRALAHTLGLTRAQGALLTSVSGAAQKAGLKVGDVITALNGQALINAAELPAVLAQSMPGDTVTVTFVRNKATQTVTATLEAPKPQMVAKKEPTATLQGISFRALAPNEGDGVRVTHVSGPSELRPGDIVTSINSVPVKALADLKRFESAKELLFYVNRNGHPFFTAISH